MPQHDPLVPVSPDGVGVAGAYGVAVSPLAVHALAPVAIDGVVTQKYDGAIGAEPLDYELCEQAGESHAGPPCRGEDALEGAGVGRCEGPEIAEEVGDGVPTGSENGGGHEGLDAAERRRGESDSKVGQDGQDVGQYNRGRSSRVRVMMCVRYTHRMTRGGPLKNA